MSSILSASDRRELVDLLTQFEGLSKTSAKRLVGDARPYDLAQSLERLRQAKLQAQNGNDLTPLPPPAQGLRLNSSSAGPKSESRSKKVPYSLLLPPEQLDALRAIADQDDSSVSHHIRQAIRTYLKGVRLK